MCYCIAMKFETPPSRVKLDLFQKRLKLVLAILAFLLAAFFFGKAGLLFLNEPRLSGVIRSSIGGGASLFLGLILVKVRNDKTPHYYDPRSYK